MNSPVPRPAVHFTAESGWINDPLGMTYVDGQYHLFFQYVPDSTEWQPNCHWGHAVSSDLVTWTEREVALAPGDGDDGAWSGSIIQHPEHGPMLFYTAVSIPHFALGTVRVATPTDGTWNTWSKGETVVVVPEELDARAFRDPYVFRDACEWRMLVGTSLSDGTAAAASFSSQDCRTWTYNGLAAQRARTVTTPVWTGSLWECPQVFEIDGSHVMVTSVWEDDVLHYVAYAIGTYLDGVFHADTWHRLTYGDSYYAPSFFRDRDGQPCLIYWLRGPGGDAAGWAGALSVSHRLTLLDGRLNSAPHPGLYGTVSALQTADDNNHARVLSWNPHHEDMDINLGTGSALSLRRVASGFEYRHGGVKRTIPCANIPDEVVVLVDGDICEVFLGESVLAIG